MLNISKYHRAQSIDEAYELNLNKKNMVLGGMLWTKMQNKTVDTAIDLCELSLNKIEVIGNEFHIGAMVSLRELETHEKLNELTCNALRDSVKQIVGVQFRNLATIGGSVYSKLGFSDVITVLLSLNAKVEFYKQGIISLEEYLVQPFSRDILTKIIIEKKQYKTVFLSQRNTKTDFPVLNCAVTEYEDKYACVIGARPRTASVVMINKQNDIQALALEASNSFTFGDNSLGSAKYRKHICSVLIQRAIEKLSEKE